MEAIDTIKRMQIVYKALLTGQIVFLVIAIFIQQQRAIPPASNELGRVLQVAAVLAALMGVAGGIYWFNGKVKALKEGNASTAEKLAQYQQSSIVKWAMAEAPILFCIISYLLTGNFSFLAFALLLMFVFAGFFPARPKVLQELGLSETDL